MPVFARPGQPGSPVSYESRYDNIIGGEYVPPVKGQYFENPSPVTGEVFTEIARSTAEDVEKAIDAAHGAAPAWGRQSPAERALILNKIADRMEQNLELLAVAETWDNGKPVRETLAADIPLAIDHFRYFAGALRAQEGSLSQIDEDTVAYHFHEPLGVVGQIIPWNFPILMATWKLAPALAAGNAVVLKPAEQTPASINILWSLISDLLPPGVLNVVQGFGAEAGKPLASSNRIAKIAFTGETTTGRLIMQYASQNLIPVSLELGGKSPNIFFADVMAQNDDFQDKALEGFTMFALNQGEVCTCPSRALIQQPIFDEFLEQASIRTKAVRQGNPLDSETMVGAQASTDQLEKIMSYIDIGKQEGARVVTGGERADLGRRPIRRLLRPADDLPGPQRDADLPGGDLRTGRVGHVLRRIRRRDQDRQRHALRARCRRLDAGRLDRVPGRPGHQGGPGLDELLPPLPGTCCFRRLQAVGHRPGEPPHDARALPADQEPAGELLAQGDGLLLDRPVLAAGRRRHRLRRPAAAIEPRHEGRSVELDRVSATPEALALMATLAERHGPLMIHQSGGCCDGSSPMCYPREDFLVGDNDVLLGLVGAGRRTRWGAGVDRRCAVRVLVAYPPHDRPRTR